MPADPRRRPRPAARRGGRPGQATLLVLVLGAALAAVALVLVALAHVAAERARAQAAADGTALAAAAALAAGEDATAAARGAARRGGARLVELALEPAGGVRVRVERRARVPLPGSSAGVLRVRPQAIAVAVPGPAAPAGAPPWAVVAVRRAAARERLPSALLLAQLAAESGFDPRARSPAGALGIAQMLPGTWAGAWNPWRRSSPLDPAAAIPAQARLMRLLVDRFDGDVARALAAYNAGPARARLPPARWPAETRAYVARILGTPTAGGAPTLVG